MSPLLGLSQPRSVRWLVEAFWGGLPLGCFGFFGSAVGFLRGFQPAMFFWFFMILGFKVRFWKKIWTGIKVKTDLGRCV